MRRRPHEIPHHFEGREALDQLLETAGSPFTSEDVVEMMRETLAAGGTASEVVPSLFDGEPKFPHPDQAKSLFSNLLGLWDLVCSGKPVELGPLSRASAPPPDRPTPPPPFAPGLPTPEFIEHARRYLERLPPREWQRLQDALENRQDAVLNHLDPRLSDEGYAVARRVVFELFAMLEWGWPRGLRSVTDAELAGPSRVTEEPPDPLLAYVRETLRDLGPLEETPPAEAAEVEARVLQTLRALWNARRS